MDSGLVLVFVCIWGLLFVLAHFWHVFVGVCVCLCLHLCVCVCVSQDKDIEGEEEEEEAVPAASKVNSPASQLFEPDADTKTLFVSKPTLHLHTDSYPPPIPQNMRSSHIDTHAQFSLSHRTLQLPSLKAPLSFD